MGPVVNNLPSSIGNMGSIPGLGRFHIPQSNEAHEAQRVSLCAAAAEATTVRSSHAATAE